MPASRRPTGRVTPKGVRPAGTNPGAARGARTFDRTTTRNGGLRPDRRSATRAAVVRTGHRGGR